VCVRLGIPADILAGNRLAAL